VIEVSVISVIVQGGSFALLVVVVLWVGKFLVPRIFLEHEKIMVRFDNALDRRDKALEAHTVELRSLSLRVGRLETDMETGNHVPLDPDKESSPCESQKTRSTPSPC
jgi:hypothetical protein